jgi:hypothetical protein
MKVRVKMLENMLGTACQNKEVHEEYIASKSADAEKVKEELEALPAEELMEKAMTVFPRDTDGMPILYDYQIRGFIKEALGVQIDLIDGEVKFGKTKLTKYSHKKIVDNFIFVFPRKIRLAPISGTCTRPLRADTMKGERVSLATSEVVPAGTQFEFEIKCLIESDPINKIIMKCLDYGALKGLGQWRNSGAGRFSWELVE